MRVALDATYSVDPQPSGIAIYSRELIHGLVAAYPRDHFLSCYRLKQFRGAPRPDRANAGRRLLLPPLPTFHADIFHALNQRVDQRPARRVVATFHDLFVITGNYSTPEFRARFSEQARRAAQRSDLIIAVSAFTAQQVSSLLAVEPSRIRVVPHGVRRPDGAADFEGREQMILFVGALQLRKNVMRLVKAFRTLPPPWKLILAGAPTGFRAEEILSDIARGECRDRITVTGYISPAELKAYFSRAMIFAFPSLDEGFGIPVLEAMASGVPVLTSNGSGLAEIGKDAAVLVNPLEVDEIAAGLRRLAENESLRRELILAGKDRAAEFSWENAVEKTYEVYQELLA